MSSCLLRWFALGGLILPSALTPLNGGEPQGLASTAPDVFQMGSVEGEWQRNSVTSILQTREGYLWLGTYHGLVRYDGVRFTVFDSSNTAELPNGRITSLHEDPDGVMWIGHETCQLTRYAGGRFHSVGPITNLSGGAIQTISSDEQGEIWLVNDLGTLLRLRDGRKVQAPEQGLPKMYVTLARERNGRLWMTANGQLGVLSEGRLKPFTFPAEKPTTYERVFAARAGGVWVLGGGKLRRWNDGDWREEAVGVPPVPGTVTALTETESGVVIGTIQEGLHVLRPGAAPLHFTRTNGLSHDWIRALWTDREGNVWIGTGTGFDGLRSRNVKVLAPADDWLGYAVLSFYVDFDGVAWVGTEGAGLYRYDGRWSVFREAEGIRNLYVWSVLETRAKELLVGTWGGGIYRREGKRFVPAEGLSDIKTPVTALYHGRQGELWIGTQRGLYRRVAGQLECVVGVAQFTLPDVRTIAESPDGTIWFGAAGGGLGRWRAGEVRQFRKADGLGSDLVSCLHMGADGALWIGTLDNGLTRLIGDRFSVVSAAQGLPNRAIGGMVDDGVGNLWMSSRGGLLRVGTEELRRCADGEIPAVHCRSYGRAEGLQYESCIGGFQPSVQRTHGGTLWFSTTRGLALVDPVNVTTNLVPPPVAIEALAVDGMATNWLAAKAGAADGPGTRRLVIPPGHRRFEFVYTALSFVAPNKVRFRRILEGLERNWVEVGSKRVVEFSYLPPGDYTFRVTACNNDEVWNEQGASVAFTVLPFFYQTLWFRLTIVVAALGSTVGSVVWLLRRRLRRRLEFLERQRAVERERTRIARDIHDDLGASLTRISLLSETIRDEVAAQPQVAADLEQIRNIAREGTRAMDEIVWAVNPQYDTLDSLVAYLGRYAERCLGAAGIRCRLDVPVLLPAWTLGAEVRHSVFLTFKEALNNVLKHAHATEVRVSVEITTDGFTLAVVDNGRGFEWSERGPEAAAGEDRVSAGNGLFNMRKRMEEIGSTCTWETKSGEGTRVRLGVVVQPDARHAAHRGAPPVAGVSY